MKRNPLVWLADTMLTITAIPVLAMMVHVTLDVALKYLFRLPIHGTLEITAYYYMVSIVVLPLAFVEWTRQSIAVDLFYQMMSPRLQLGVTLLVLLISAIGYGGLTLVSIPTAMEGLHRREIVMGTVNIYIWPTRFLLPFALFLAMSVCLIHAIRLFVSAEARRDLTSVSLPDANIQGN